MVLKKKEIIAASLVVLIGVAGYLNWSYQDTIRVRDGESYIETGKRLGEAQYVSTSEEIEEKNVGSDNSSDNAEGESVDESEEASARTEAESDLSADEEGEGGEQAEETASRSSVSEDYFDNAKMDREASRSKALEILNNTAENDSFDEEIRKKAGDKILGVAENVRKESEIEGIAQSKGYSEICVYVDGDEANVVVRKAGFNDSDVVKLTEIVTDQMKISAQNVKIVEVK